MLKDYDYNRIMSMFGHGNFNKERIVRMWDSKVVKVDTLFYLKKSEYFGRCGIHCTHITRSG